MEKETASVPVDRFVEGRKTSATDLVVREVPLTIVLNSQELVTLLCSPAGLDYLAVGFLVSEGLLKTREDLRGVTVDDRAGVARVETATDAGLPRDALFKRVITSGCGRGASLYSAADVGTLEKVESRTLVSSAEILALMHQFQQRSEVYRATGGVHSAALCDTKTTLVFAEDIGRHNAIDKVFGRCLLDDVATEGRIVTTSGRVSSEMLFKVARRGVPLVVSKSAPTNLGIRLAGELGITLVGFVRGKRMTVYSNSWRIASDQG